MTLGEEALLDEYGGYAGLAEAMILGIYKGTGEGLVTPVTLEAARIRLKAHGKLNPKDVRLLMVINSSVKK